MSSLEIAELTGKEHHNVLVDARNMLNTLGLDAAGFSAAQIYGNNNRREVFNLPKDLTLTLVSELTGKIHKNVLADARGMFEQLGVHSAEFSAQYKDSTGRGCPQF